MPKLVDDDSIHVARLSCVSDENHDYVPQETDEVLPNDRMNDY